MPQPGRQHLLEFDQGAERGLADTAHPADRGRAQGDRHRDGFLVVELQRRQLRARLEVVAAVDALHRAHRVVQRAQFVDIAAHRAGADLQALGELVAGPFAPGLQQCEQPK